MNKFTMRVLEFWAVSLLGTLAEKKIIPADLVTPGNAAMLSAAVYGGTILVYVAISHYLIRRWNARSVNGLLLCLLLLCCSSCAHPGTPAGDAGQWIENNLPVIEASTDMAATAALQYATSDPSARNKLANEIYSSANALYSLCDGSIPTTEQIKNCLIAFGGDPDDAQYMQYVQSLTDLYTQYYSQLGGNGQAAMDLLKTMATGAQHAANRYLNTSSAKPLQQAVALN